MIKFLDLQKITQKYSSEIKEATNRVIDSGWFLQGKENETFEKQYAHYIGTEHCVGCANGLDALIWIFRAYIELGKLLPGDEVIVQANTYIASILSISETGLICLFPLICIYPNSSVAPKYNLPLFSSLNTDLMLVLFDV